MPKAYAIRRCPYEGDVILKFNKTTQFKGDPREATSMWAYPQHGAPSYWGEFDLGYVEDESIHWDFVVYRALQGIGLRVLPTWTYSTRVTELEPERCFLLPVPFTFFSDHIAARAYVRPIVDVFLEDMRTSWYHLASMGFYESQE